MREILFRGKRIDNGEWITGGIFQQKADDVKDEVVYIIDNSSNDVDWAHRVIPETVGQFTGVTDKKGNRVFEEVYSDMSRISQRRKRVFRNNSTQKYIRQTTCV